MKNLILLALTIFLSACAKPSDNSTPQQTNSSLPKCDANFSNLTCYQTVCGNKSAVIWKEGFVSVGNQTFEANGIHSVNNSSCMIQIQFPKVSDYAGF